MVEYIIGDVLNCGTHICCHQVNCKGVMGSGLAKQVKSKYPDVFNRYNTACKENTPDWLLGKVQLITCGDTIIANLFAQDGYGYDNKVYTNYDALEKCIKTVSDVCKKSKMSVAFPYKLGCDRGGGDWEIVNNLINKYFKDLDVICKIVKLK